jgi:hypothetical protein
VIKDGSSITNNVGGSAGVEAVAGAAGAAAFPLFCGARGLAIATEALTTPLGDSD